MLQRGIRKAIHLDREIVVGIGSELRKKAMNKFNVESIERKLVEALIMKLVFKIWIGILTYQFDGV